MRHLCGERPGGQSDESSQEPAFQFGTPDVVVHHLAEVIALHFDQAQITLV